MAPSFRPVSLHLPPHVCAALVRLAVAPPAWQRHDPAAMAELANSGLDPARPLARPHAISAAVSRAHFSWEMANALLISNVNLCMCFLYATHLPLSMAPRGEAASTAAAVP